MARGRADVANTALRIFLQEMGAEYDKERGFTPLRRRERLPEGLGDMFADLHPRSRRSE